ncbi:MAG: AAA family ATPase [Candidatus Eisenbacteria bacterium]|nr:AAA family ATPase [Candidatus Eisenbacteria bacterium]
MKLRRLKVDGFGALKGEFFFSPEHVALIVDDNERGKSTLLAAIAAALYGLDGDRRTHRLVTPRDRWRPWDGGPYRVELDVQVSGEDFCIARDFARDTVAIWNTRGQEVTAEFREGKDEYPVGKRWTGLDADEFAKCALVGQNELDAVVPVDEKSRRGSTLHARLENAADTRVGDTNATEAIRVIEIALRKYTCPEVESSGTIDTALARLETKRGLLDTELRALEHDFAGIAEPLDALVGLVEEERTVREGLQRLDGERSNALASDARRQLADDRLRRDELARLVAEADAAASAAHLEPNTEAEFREVVARYEEAARGLQALEERRREELAREREKRGSELGELARHADRTAADADRCVAVAAELRRIAEDDASTRTAVFTLREALARQGHDPERIQSLSARFAKRSDAEQRLLRRQNDRALVYQTEVAQLEQMRTGSTEVLREIDALRNRWRLPGWFLTALGLAAALAGVVVQILNGLPVLWTSLLAAGATLLILGLGLLMAGARARAAERAASLRQLSEAQRRLHQMRTDRAEAEVGLAELARAMGYRDQVDLLREWSEYARLMEESAPALRAQEQLATIEARRRQAMEAARALVAADTTGGGERATIEPADLERVAQDIRRALALQQRLVDLETGWEWMAEERRVAEAAATGLKDRAVRILHTAGLAYDPSLSWAEHTRELAERAQAQARHALLTGELIPQAEGRVLAAGRAAELEHQLRAIETERVEAAGAEGAASRAPLEIEAEGRRLREALDQLQKRRTDLRLEVEEVLRRYQTEHPDKTAQRERIDQALLRARRFKAAADLAKETIASVATETHRRWADYLNQRVTQLLGAFGARVEQLRFGDDLDFSVKLWNGQQVARGRADLQLSAGAKDQLYLAVRLAIAEFLSRGQSPLPLLLDDPFATSDDERARAGMKLLIEHFAPLHQIIVLTCHRRRYAALAQMDEALYAERVRIFEIKTTGANAAT